jgi:prevent-host-death family protein
VFAILYSGGVEVSVTQLRANLATWLDEVQHGLEITVTDHGRPVARLVPVAAAALIKDLTDRGVLGLPETTVRKRAAGRERVKIVGQIGDISRDEWR